MNSIAKNKYNIPVDRIQGLIEKAIEKDILPGAVVLVSHCGQTIFEGAFGMADIEKGRRQNVDDLFFLGSTSKPLATSSILTLIEDGKLELYNPAGNWIPEYNKAVLKNKKSVRSPIIREMLSHTAGIFGNSTATKNQKQMLWNFNLNLAKTAAQISRQPLIYPPGEGFSYGGASMTVTGRIVELITKMEFDRFAHEALFTKLGMHDTFYRTKMNCNDRISVLYSNTGSGLIKARFQPNARPGSLVLPPGSIISTAHDLSSFINIHLHNGKHKKTQILSNDLIVKMRKDATYGNPMDFKTYNNQQSTVNNEGYGLGWILNDLDTSRNARVFFHGGAFGTLIWGDIKTRLGIILLTHTPYTQVAQLWDDVITIIRESGE